MRITLVQPYITTQAISKQYYNIQSFGLSAELVKRGHQVTILTMNLIRPEVKSKKDAFKRFEEEIEGFRVVYIPTLAESGGIPIFPTLPAEIVRSKPDLVQAAEDAQLASLCAVLCCKALRVPVTIYQGMYSFTSSHVALRKAYSRTAGWPVYKLADAFICKSNAAKQFVISRGVPRNRAHVIPVGFKRDNHRRVESSILRTYFETPPNRIMLSVGRLAPEKGCDVAILAMKQIVAKFPDTGYLILGDGPERSRLSELIRANGLARNVRIVTDKVPNTEMDRLYSSAFLYLIPSSYEIFNMTMLEALGCGCPVIACRVGGMADTVKDGVTGCLFEPGDIDTLAERMAELLCDEAKWKPFSEAAQVDMDSYDWSPIAERVLDIYTKVVNHKWNTR